MAIEAELIERASVLVSDLARCDVSDLLQGEFLAAFDAVSRLGRFADALRARFAGDLARRSTPELPGGGLARSQGFGSAASMVASVTGGSQAGAWRAIEAGLALMPDPAAGLDPDGALDSADFDPADFDPADFGPAGPPAPSTPSTSRYPAIAGACLAGELSVDAAGLITAGLETLTDRIPSGDLHELESRLVAKAVGLAAHEVRRLVSVAVARADVAGLQERERRQYQERFFAWAEDTKGMVTFTGRLDAVTAAPIRTVIEQVVTHQFRNRRDQDPTEPDKRTAAQMRADALFDICRHALGCKDTARSGIRTTIVVRMTKTDLDAATSSKGAAASANGTTAATSTAVPGTATTTSSATNCGTGVGSIDGTTVPVTVSELRRLAGDAGIIPAVLGGESEVLDLGRKVRMFTQAQRLALLDRDGGCAKCHAPPEHCEAHHIRWWDHGGTTDLSNGVMLCTRCHHDIHRQHWDIRATSNHVEFIPPVDIDPLQRPIPGGLAATTLTHDHPVIPDPRENSAGESSAPHQDTADSATRENSARTQDALIHDQRESSARTQDTAGGNAWNAAA